MVKEPKVLQTRTDSSKYTVCIVCEKPQLAPRVIDKVLFLGCVYEVFMTRCPSCGSTSSDGILKLRNMIEYKGIRKDLWSLL